MFRGSFQHFQPRNEKSARKERLPVKESARVVPARVGHDDDNGKGSAPKAPDDCSARHRLSMRVIATQRRVVAALCPVRALY